MRNLQPCSVILKGLRSPSLDGVSILKKAGVSSDLAERLIRTDAGRQAVVSLETLERLVRGFDHFVSEEVLPRIGDPSYRFVPPPGVTDQSGRGGEACETLRRILEGPSGPALVKIADSVREAEPEMVEIPSGYTSLGSEMILKPEENGLPYLWWFSTFDMARTPVTNRQYRSLARLGIVPELQEPPWGLLDDWPAVKVGWDGARQFARGLSILTGQDPARWFRPPFEFEFERAARGGGEDLFTYWLSQGMPSYFAEEGLVSRFENPINGPPSRQVFGTGTVKFHNRPKLLDDLLRDHNKERKRWNDFDEGASSLEIVAWHVYGTAGGGLYPSHARYGIDPDPKLPWWQFWKPKLGPGDVYDKPPNPFDLRMMCGGVRQMTTGLWRVPDPTEGGEARRVFLRQVEDLRRKGSFRTRPVLKAGSWAEKDVRRLMAAGEEPYAGADLFTGFRLARGGLGMLDGVRIAGEI